MGDVLAFTDGGLSFDADDRTLDREQPVPCKGWRPAHSVAKKSITCGAGTDQSTNIPSESARLGLRDVAQQGLEQADYLGLRTAGGGKARSAHEDASLSLGEAEPPVGVPTGARRLRAVPVEAHGVAVGRSEVLERPVTKMYGARALHPGRGRLINGATARLGDLEARGLRDDRSAVGGLPGLLRAGSVLEYLFLESFGRYGPKRASRRRGPSPPTPNRCCCT